MSQAPGSAPSATGEDAGGSERRLLGRWTRRWFGAGAAERVPHGPTLERATADLARREREIAFLSDAGQLFQACRTLQELCAIGSDRLAMLSKDLSGALYLIDRNGDYLEPVMTWGATEAADMNFAPGDCWSLRCGRPHRVSKDHRAVACAHVRPGDGDWHLCLPLLAQGETLGVLHFRADARRGRRAEFEALTAESRMSFYLAISETLSLAIANIKLRESLQQQAIRDPLTGLFNRRYFEETLRRELHRSLRSGLPLALVIFDIDHFKRFNDTFGHDAGDAALKTVGEILLSKTRGGDVACRYGGEEFALAFPGLSAGVAARRVEALRLEIAGREIRYLGQSIGPVTISGGVAVYPDHATDSAGLVRTADLALYASKEGGRNRFTMANLDRRSPDQQTGLSLVHSVPEEAARRKTKALGD